ncbi:MAG: hypothetical protein H6736_24810 [Alphaproteobacteria bacterium]|nr:hypothetical protein [Alphaproteobacteria bacterium]
MSSGKIHSQTGLVGEVEVAPDGTATFRTTLDGRTRTRVQGPAEEPLQAGPTLFGHVLRHWDALVAGETRVIRFVVLERRRAFRFGVRLADSPAGTTAFEMTPASPLVAMGVPRGRIVFDQDRRVVRYEGLVPPLEGVGGRLRRLDASVTYEHTAGPYR